ncbi:MAG: PAS domain S-box protein [Halothiobacillus sp.]|nr:PAS domain S-box protein [Halothiobacillus sp.]
MNHTPPKPLLPTNETERLRVMRELDFLNEKSNDFFLRKLKIIRRVFGVPIALIALTDAYHQRIKAVLGLNIELIDRELALCSYAQTPPYDPLVIPDTRLDPRSRDSEMVTGAYGVRFYAGAALVLDEQFAVGTLCIMDTEPRSFSADEQILLQDFALNLTEVLQARLDAERSAELQRQNARVGLELNTVLQTAAIGIIRIDEHGLIEAVNPKARALFGYSEQEMLGHNVSLLMPEPWRSAHDGYLMRFLATRDPKVIGIGRRVEGVHRDGSRFPFNLAVSELRVDGVSQFVGFVSDISDQVEAEQALERERALLRSVIDSSTNPIAAVNAANEFILLNTSFARLLGKPVEAVLGLKSELFLPPQALKINRETNARVWASGSSISTRTPIEIAGQKRVFETNKSPLRDEQGKQIGVVTVAQDVSELDRITSDLLAMQQLRDMSERHGQSGSWALDPLSDRVKISAGLARLLGLAPETTEAERRVIFERIHSEDRAAIEAAFTQELFEGQSIRFAYRVRDANGDWRHLRARGNAIFDDSGQVTQFVGITQDVTEEVRAQEKMDAQQQLLGGLNKAVQSFLTAVAGDKSVWSELLGELLAVTDAEFGFIGEVLHGIESTPCLKIHAITNLSWSGESDALFERVMAGDMMFCNPDNLIGEVMKSRAPVIVPELATDSRRGGFPPGHPQLSNYLGIPLFRGEDLVGVLAIANRQKGVSSELVDFLTPFTSSCAILIVSLRQQLERIKFEQDLIESRKAADRANKAKSMFLSSMSHELRTPLNAILGFTQLMAASRREPLTEKQSGFVDHILKAGQHLLTLINDVLNLAKIEAGEMSLSPETLDLDAILADALNMVADNAVSTGIALINELDSAPDGTKPLLICADLTRSRQVLINVLTNAIKYNRVGGSVRVRHLPGRQNDAGAWMHGLAIEDTGMGIPAAQQHRLFRPFERLGQEAGTIEGTGIGLLITRQLIELMKGEIRFESEEGKGTTFFLWWPAVREDQNDTCGEQPDAKNADEPLASKPKASIQSTKITVLYIEDNPSNSALMQSIVDDREDIRLILAPDGEQGLELALTEQPDLILMDINLPGMSGQQVAAKLKQWVDTASILIVALSADATAPMQQSVKQSGLFDRYLSKPIDVMQLTRLFDELIAGRSTDDHGF